MKNITLKTVSFFGHRNTDLNEEKLNELECLIEKFILDDGAQIFLFGSRSNFDYICHKIVTKLKEKYPQIQR